MLSKYDPGKILCLCRTPVLRMVNIIRVIVGLISGIIWIGSVCLVVFQHWWPNDLLTVTVIEVILFIATFLLLDKPLREIKEKYF